MRTDLQILNPDFKPWSGDCKLTTVTDLESKRLKRYLLMIAK